MFNLLSKRPNMKCHVSDLNSDLILAYVAIRDKVAELTESLENHSKKYQKNPSQYYYLGLGFSGIFLSDFLMILLIQQLYP